MHGLPDRRFEWSACAGDSWKPLQPREGEPRQPIRPIRDDSGLFWAFFGCIGNTRRL